MLSFQVSNLFLKKKKKKKKRMFQVQDYFKQEIKFKGYVIIEQATLKYKLSSYWSYLYF